VGRSLFSLGPCVLCRLQLGFLEHREWLTVRCTLSQRRDSRPG
jgi:hypothetical protein